MKLMQLEENRVVFLSLSGEMDETEFKTLELRLRKLREDGQTSVVLDLSKVEHMNYKVVGELIDWQKRFRDYSGDIKLVNVSSYLYDILRLYGFYPFEIYPSRRAAMKSFAHRA